MATRRKRNTAAPAAVHPITAEHLIDEAIAQARSETAPPLADLAESAVMTLRQLLESFDYAADPTSGPAGTARALAALAAHLSQPRPARPDGCYPSAKVRNLVDRVAKAIAEDGPSAGSLFDELVDAIIQTQQGAPSKSIGDLAQALLAQTAVLECVLCHVRNEGYDTA